MKRYDVATGTDPGRARDRNEDAVLAGSFDDGSWVLIVCDGMGGHDAGDVASKTACRRIYQEVNARQDDPNVGDVLVEALHCAHEEILEAAAQTGSDMGTTAVVARLIENELWFAWVGDSRLYLARGGGLLTASVDHTLIQEHIEAGRLHPNADHSDHPDAHVLTQALGGDVDLAPTVTDMPIELQSEDLVLLCSDGLHDLIQPEETLAFVGRDLEVSVQTLIDEANRREGHDNITVALARRR